MLDGLRAVDPLTRSSRAKSRQIARAEADLAAERGAWPTDAEVAERLNIALSRLQDLRQNVNVSFVPLENPEDDSDSEPGSGWIASLADPSEEGDPQCQLDESDLHHQLQEAIRHLPERERRVLGLYYAQDKRTRTIGHELGISESRVSQLHARAIAHLCKEMEESLMAPSECREHRAALPHTGWAIPLHRGLALRTMTTVKRDPIGKEVHTSQ